jgi:hypothetical protein
MSTTAFCIGAYLAGWLLPELIFLHSERTGRVPIGINIWSAIAFTLLAYGVRA